MLYVVYSRLIIKNNMNAYVNEAKYLTQLAQHIQTILNHQQLQ